MIDDVQFPLSIAPLATGGPVHVTSVQQLASGAEVRIASWATPLGRWDISSGVKSSAQYAELLAFFRGRQGRLRGFRFRDWSDYVMPRAAIGTTDTATAAFQLVKPYTSGSQTRGRKITRPVSATVRVWVDGTERTLGSGGTQFQVNLSTGVVTIGATLAATTGQAVEAACEFDVPARFDSDSLALTLEVLEAGEWVEVPIVEIRE